MKNLLILLLNLFIIFSCTPIDVGDHSTVKHIKNKETLITAQHGDFWCWAATAEAVQKYYGHKENQTQIVKDFYKLDFISPTMMISPRMALPFSLGFKYEKEVLNKNELKTRYILQYQIEQYIDNNIPIIAVYSNHVAVITGYKKDGNLTTEYEVMDPQHQKNKTKPFIWLYPSKISQATHWGGKSIFIAITAQNKELLNQIAKANIKKKQGVK